jgi:arylsulfatase A-like enzyme
MFEESLMMPFVIRWPGVIMPGTLSTALIQNIDYAPTFLDLCGATIPDDIQGRSIVPVLWRLNNGNLRKQQDAKVAVVMIGTNNTGHNKQDPAEGIEPKLKELGL